MCGKHITHIGFYEWDLDTKNFHLLNNIDYKIKYLSFDGWGIRLMYNWPANEEYFLDILTAIAKCSLKKSLKRIKIPYWGIKKQTCNKILKLSKLKKVMVDGYASSTYNSYEIW